MAYEGGWMLANRPREHLPIRVCRSFMGHRTARRHGRNGRRRPATGSPGPGQDDATSLPSGSHIASRPAAAAAVGCPEDVSTPDLGGPLSGLCQKRQQPDRRAATFQANPASSAAHWRHSKITNAATAVTPAPCACLLTRTCIHPARRQPALERSSSKTPAGIPDSHGAEDCSAAWRMPPRTGNVAGPQLPWP